MFTKSTVQQYIQNYHSDPPETEKPETNKPDPEKNTGAFHFTKGINFFNYFKKKPIKENKKNSP
jgi:hypothetical protein